MEFLQTFGTEGHCTGIYARDFLVVPEVRVGGAEWQCEILQVLPYTWHCQVSCHFDWCLGSHSHLPHVQNGELPYQQEKQKGVQEPSRHLRRKIQQNSARKKAGGGKVVLATADAHPLQHVGQLRHVTVKVSASWASSPFSSSFSTVR